MPPNADAKQMKQFWTSLIVALASTLIINITNAYISQVRLTESMRYMEKRQDEMKQSIDGLTRRLDGVVDRKVESNHGF